MDPLRARACETLLAERVICDPKSVELTRRLGFEPTNFWKREYQLAVAVRTEIFDEVAEFVISRHPDTVVVNLGSGLDTRFCRIDNGTVRWYEIDLPNVIRIRKAFFLEHDRYRTIPGSIPDGQWLHKIPRDAPTLFIVEGLAVYLEEHQMRAIVDTIVTHFSDARIVVDVLGLFFVKLVNQPEYKWGVCKDNCLSTWNDRLHLIDSWCVFERHPKRWAEFRHLAPLMALSKNVHIIYYFKVDKI